MIKKPKKICNLCGFAVSERALNTHRDSLNCWIKANSRHLENKGFVKIYGIKRKELVGVSAKFVFAPTGKSVDLHARKFGIKGAFYVKGGYEVLPKILDNRQRRCQKRWGLLTRKLDGVPAKMTASVQHPREEYRKLGLFYLEAQFGDDKWLDSEIHKVTLITKKPFCVVCPEKLSKIVGDCDCRLGKVPKMLGLATRLGELGIVGLSVCRVESDAWALRA